VSADTTKNTAAANSELPDEDALAAFATNAFGSGRRRKRGGDTGKKEPAAAAAQPSVVGERQPETAVPPQPAQETPEPEPAKPEPTVVVPAPALAPIPPAAQVPPRGPNRQHDAPEESSPAVPGGEHTQVAVRAVEAPAPAAHRPVPLAYRADVPIDQVQVPALGPAGARATQCTVMISQNVRDRFAHYQLSKKMAGDREPSNALVVRRAFLHCKRNDLFGKLLSDVYQQNNAVDDEDYDEDGMLGEVVGRRAVRGRLKDSGQQSFRPSEQELVTYDAYSQAYGFPSRSDFLNAVLDEFLPQLPSGRRK
jgi:hypothetical protein